MLAEFSVVEHVMPDGSSDIRKDLAGVENGDAHQSKSKQPIKDLFQGVLRQHLRKERERLAKEIASPYRREDEYRSQAEGHSAENEVNQE